MKFLVKWSIPRDKWVQILKVWTSMTHTQRADAGLGVKIVGRWHDVSARTGVLVPESTDAAAEGLHLSQRNGMCNLEVAPVLADEESPALGRKALAALGV